MELLVGIANLVVLLIVIEGWVNGRIPGALARTIDERIDNRANLPNTRLDGLDGRLRALDARLDGLDGRLRALDARLDGLDLRVSGLDTRIAELASRIDRVDAQVAVLNAQASKQISDLDRHVREGLRGLDGRLRAPEAEAGETPS